MPHVFISYVHENRADVKRLADELSSHGVKVWLDESDLRPGDRWRFATKEAIKAGSFFMACFSKEFAEREKSYMHAELTIAIDELRERPHDTVWFLPVLINETAVPSRPISSVESLSDLHAVKLYEGWADGISSILRSVKKDDSDLTRADIPAKFGGELFALGRDIVFSGKVTKVDAVSWTLQIKDFLYGDELRVISLIDGFVRKPDNYKYILSCKLGDGRILSEPPVLSNGDTLMCPVAPGFMRKDVQDLGSAWATYPETNDIYAEKGQLARVSGLDYFPQCVREVLSLQLGESPFEPDIGAQFFAYLRDFRDSPWLEQLLTLEVIRHMSIPYHHCATKEERLPLPCITHVRSVRLLSDVPRDNRIPMRFVFDVQGIGRWQRDIPIFIPSIEQMGKVARRKTLWGTLLRGQ